MAFTKGYAPANTGKSKDLTGQRFGRLVAKEKFCTGALKNYCALMVKEV